MKRYLLVIIAIILVSGIIFAGCGAPAPAPAPAPSPSPAPAPAPSPAPAPKPVELKLATGQTATDIMYYGFLEPYAKALDATGKFKTTLYSGGAPGGPTEQWEMVRTGVVDVSVSLQAYYAGVFPLTSVMELPFLGITSAQEGSRILMELYQKLPAFQNEYKDVKVLSLATYNPNQLQMAKKLVKVKEDMNGMKIRGTGEVQADIIRLLGGIPVTMPAPEIYTSLERGVLDGTFFSVTGLFTFKFSEVVKYITEADLFVGTFFLVMNKDKWNSLPPDLQAAMEEVAGMKMAVDVSGKTWDTETQKGWDLAQQKGIERYKLPAEELARWREAVSPIYENWIKKMEDKNLPGRAVYEEALKLAQ